MANTDESYATGDWLWSPNGENEWCLLYQVTGSASWHYFQPSTGTTFAGPQDLTLYPPRSHRVNAFNEIRSGSAPTS